MAKGLTLLCLTALACSAMGKQVVSRRSPDPTAWKQVGRSDATKSVSFSIFLKGEKEDELDQKMQDIAVNREPWLTKEGLATYVTPAADVTAALEAHLVAHGVSKDAISYNDVLGNVLSVDSTVENVESLFNTTLYDYQNLKDDQVHSKVLTAYLPDEIAQHVISVDKVASFEAPHRYRKSPMKRQQKRDIESLHEFAKRDSIPTAYTPPHVPPPGCSSFNHSYPCIAQFYGYQNYTPARYAESASVLAYGGLWTIRSLRRFIAAYRQDAPSTYLPRQSQLNGDRSVWLNITQDDIEDVMDIEILVGVAYPLYLTSIDADDYDFGDAVQSLVNMPDYQRPGTVSVSYGVQETDVTEDNALSFCKRTQHLVTLGTTFMTGSGDNGVAVNDASQCPPFKVDMMSGCPYTLSIGATTGFNPERAVFLRNRPDVDNGWSSGGFSSFHTMPDYQKGIVDVYLQSIGTPYAQYYNTTGRGFTDVSAFGEFIDLAENGQYDADGGGTSASGPIWASILALVNAKCKEKGKPRVGWVHPTFYKNVGSFGDITVGGAYDCAGTDYGFPCQKGWDPATGLGSPTWQNLLDMFGCA